MSAGSPRRTAAPPGRHSGQAPGPGRAAPAAGQPAGRPAQATGPGRSSSAESEQPLGDAAHLHLLRAFGDTVPAMVAVYVLEGLVPGVAQAAENLHRAVGGLAGQPVRAVV